jgi:hypothetical protein
MVSREVGIDRHDEIFFTGITVSAERQYTRREPMSNGW